ncbi:phage tail fiber protein [Pseudomonas rossensis]|uniref:phage tail fiber domain-containing protein n=1 Tax=Pseudomonas rossensis TaxID=2305471 RepID=UPI003261884C
MTVPTLNSIAEFVTNGVTTNFPFFFKFLANEDLVVTYVNSLGAVTVLTLGTHYTVNGAGDEDGGSIVTTTAMAGPGQLVVSREMDAYQQTSLRNQGKFLAETHEDVFDRLTMLIQQGFSIFKRALVRPFGKPYYDAENRNISNLADPVEMQDATTKNWVSNHFAGLIDQVTGLINTATGILYDAGTLFDHLRFGVNRTVDTIAALRLLSGSRNQRAFVLGYYAKGDGGGGHYYMDAADITSADNKGSIIVAADGGRWKLVHSGTFRGEQFGMRGSGNAAYATSNTDGLLAAIRALRTNLKVVDKGDAAHTMVNCYTSGKITLGNGVFCINSGALNFTEDHGLIIEGNGSRGASGSNQGNTVLLYKGTNSPYILRVEGNGARGFQMRGLDLCYDNGGFVGGVVDLLTTVGYKFEDVFFGSLLLTGGGTVTSAAWLIRVNEYEAGQFNKCVFHGAAIGVYFDDIAGGSTWLGAGLLFDNCWFYDFTDAHMRGNGAKVARSVALKNVGFNPINVSPTRCLNLTNMDGFTMETCLLESSSGVAPSVEWLRVLGSQGSIRDTTIGDHIKAGTLSGHLCLTSNNIGSPDGLTFLQGSISTDANRFDNCAIAVNLVSLVDTLHIDCRNDRFGVGVGISYRSADPSTLISGKISYAKSRDFSVNRFSNVNPQVEFVGEGTEVVSGGRSLTRADTGKTFFLNSGAVVTLPNPPLPGVTFNFIKTGSGTARVDAAVANQLYTGDGAAKTSLVATNTTDFGVSFSVRSFNATSWTCCARSAGWTST